MLTARFLFSGFPDYFSGNNGILLHAYYGRNTTLHDIIDQLVDNSATSEELPENVTYSDVREALLDMLSEEGRADYDSGALAECSVDFAEVNALTECPECNVNLDPCSECPFCGYEFNNYDYEDFCEDFCEFPVFIVLLEYEEDND